MLHLMSVPTINRMKKGMRNKRKKTKTLMSNLPDPSNLSSIMHATEMKGTTSYQLCLQASMKILIDF